MLLGEQQGPREPQVMVLAFDMLPSFVKPHLPLCSSMFREIVVKPKHHGGVPRLEKLL